MRQSDWIYSSIVRCEPEKSPTATFGESINDAPFRFYRTGFAFSDFSATIVLRRLCSVDACAVGSPGGAARARLLGRAVAAAVCARACARVHVRARARSTRGTLGTRRLHPITCVRPRSSVSSARGLRRSSSFVDERSICSSVRARRVINTRESGAGRAVIIPPSITSR